MVKFWKVISVLSTRASQAQGFSNLPHSLEHELFYCQRHLLTHLINNTRDGDASERFSPPSETADLSIHHHTRFAQLLHITLNLPHIERLVRHNFDEAENILRLMANSYFSTALNSDVLQSLHRFAALVYDVMKDHLSTANMILLLTLLERDEQSRWKSSRKKRWLPSGKVAEEAGSTRSRGNAVAASSSIHFRQDQGRERLIQLLFSLLAKRLARSTVNGFEDDVLTALLERATPTIGYRRIQMNSLPHSMSYTEFTYLVNLLVDRVHRVDISGAPVASSLADKATRAGEEAEQAAQHRIPQHLIRSVADTLQKLTLFRCTREISQHRVLDTQEVRFILEVAVSPITQWSVVGVAALRDFFRSQSERCPSQDVLESYNEKDCIFIRSLTLRRLRRSHVNRIPELLLQLLPLFGFPDTSSGRSGFSFMAQWGQVASMSQLTLRQKIRLFSICRTALNLMRYNPQGTTLLGMGISDDCILMEFMAKLSDFFVDEAHRPVTPSEEEGSAAVSPAAAARKKEIECLLLHQERVRVYFIIVDHCEKRRTNSLTSIPSDQFYSYFSRLVTLLYDPSVSSTRVEGSIEAMPSGHTVSQPSALPSLFSREAVSGMVDLYVPLLSMIHNMIRSPPNVQMKAKGDITEHILPTREVLEHLEFSLLHSINDMMLDHVKSGGEAASDGEKGGRGSLLRVETILPVMRFLSLLLTNNYWFSSANRRNQKPMGGSGLTVPQPPHHGEDRQGRMCEAALHAAAALANTSLDLYLQARGGSESHSKSEEADHTATASQHLDDEEGADLTSLAVLSVMLLNGMALPPALRHLQQRGMGDEIMVRLFDDFGVHSQSILFLFELLSLAFTRKVLPPGDVDVSLATAHTSAVGEGFDMPVDAKDVSVLKAGLKAASRIAGKHKGYEQVSLLERGRIVEHCIRIYIAVAHAFQHSDVAVQAGFRCLSAVAFLSLEHQQVMQQADQKRQDAFARRRLQFFSQAVWAFYCNAISRPVRIGQQVKKYMVVIERFLRHNHHVSMIPVRYITKVGSLGEESSLALVRNIAPAASSSPSCAHPHTVEWIDIQTVQKVNELFIIQIRRQHHRTAPQLFRTDDSFVFEGEGDGEDGHETGSSVTPLTPHEAAVLRNNLLLRKSLRAPIHAFLTANTSSRESGAARRALQVCELYMTIIHDHAHEMLPELWREVCLQMMHFRQISIRAHGHDRNCLLDVGESLKVQSVMQQLLYQYVCGDRDSSSATKATRASSLGATVLSFLVTCDYSHGRRFHRSPEGVGSCSSLGCLSPDQLGQLLDAAREEVERSEDSCRVMCEKEFLSYTSILYKGLRELLTE